MGLELGGSLDSLRREGPWQVVGKKGMPIYTFDRHTDCGQEDYEVIKVTADSGAADHVAPVDMAQYVELKETEASRQGIKYVAANGHRITNLGQREVQGKTDEGVSLGITWQVADIKKPLASIGRMCDAGNVAVFTKGGGYVVPQGVMNDTLRKLESQTGTSALKMKRDNGGVLLQPQGLQAEGQDSSRYRQ